MTAEQRLRDCLSSETVLTIYAIEPPTLQEDWDIAAHRVKQILSVAEDMLEHGATIDSVCDMIHTGIINNFPQKPTVDFMFSDNKVMVVLDYARRTGNTFIHTSIH